MSQIIPATIEDAEAISTLVNSAYRGDYARKGWTTEAGLLESPRTTPEAIRELINKPGTLVLKYVLDEKIIGCVQLDTHGDKLYLGMLTVEPTIQGGGIGKKMLYAAEDVARKQNCKKIYMSVLSGRSELIAWYVRHGYHDNGKRKPYSYYDSKLERTHGSLEFIEMEKEITKEFY